jgi:hypothetical protein
MNINDNKVINLFPERKECTDATIIWDYENIPLKKGKDFEFIYKRIRDLNFKYYLTIYDIIVMGNPLIVNPEHMSAFEKYEIDFVDTQSDKNHKSDMNIQLKLSDLSIENINDYHVFILISGDKDFADVLTSLKKNPLHKTIVIHKDNSNNILLESAHVAINWNDFICQPKVINGSGSMSNVNDSGYSSDELSSDSVASNYGCTIRFYASNVVEKFVVSGSLPLSLENIVEVEYSKNGKSRKYLGRVVTTYNIPKHMKQKKQPKNITLLARNEAEYKSQQQD